MNYILRENHDLSVIFHKKIKNVSPPCYVSVNNKITVTVAINIIDRNLKRVNSNLTQKTYSPEYVSQRLETVVGTQIYKRTFCTEEKKKNFENV